MHTRIHAAAVCATTAVLVTAGVRADPTVSNAPPVFCMRITDIERCPDDISGASFIIEFEVLNWTDKPACGLTMVGNLGVFFVGPQLMPPWFNGVPLITKAYVDEDGRGGPIGGFDIGLGVFDTPAIHSGRGRGDIAGHLNDWFVAPVGTGLTGHYTVTWVAPGLPAVGSCIPERDLLDRFEELPFLNANDPDDLIVINEILGASWANVPGVGTDDLGDSAVDGGPAPYTESVPPPPFPTGGPPVPDGSGNVLDGFVIEVCDWHPGEMLILNWWLLDENLVPLGTAVTGNSFGFGTMALIRLPPGVPPPPGAPFAGNAGFASGGVDFFDSVWSVPAQPGPGGHPAADFAVEFGAGITAPEIPGDENPFGAPVNTISLWPDLHECDPFAKGAPPCPWDTSGDGQVGIVDFLDLLGHWGDCP
ncbi:MAG: hypothetical protein IID28_11100 [Planctomycetes bacterium]|nr:hypothetical protein [Planctomycetota bacterium]